MNSINKNQKHWLSLDDYENSDKFLSTLKKEFPNETKETKELNRRKFLSILGAGMTLTSIAATGCIRRPKEYIYPSASEQAENIIPGLAKYYSTSAFIAGGSLGLSVTSIDGRPTKIDGNYRHPFNNPFPDSKLGSSNVWAQAEILNLYDPDRGQYPTVTKKEVDKKQALDTLTLALSADKSTEGSGIALLYPTNPSPSFYSLLTKFKKLYPKAHFYEQDSSYSFNRQKGLSQIAHQAVDAFYDLRKASVILSIDSDFLNIEGDSVRLSREFAEGRRVTNASNAKMNRLYCIESNFSITGASADHRYSLRSSAMGDFLIQLAKELVSLGVTLAGDIHKFLPNTTILNDPNIIKWIKAIARDLNKNQSSSVIIVGDRQADWMHALAYNLNFALANAGKTVFLMPDTKPFANTYQNLKEDLSTHKINTLIILGGNPVYTSAIDLNFAELFSQVKNSFYLGYFLDETAQVCKSYFPKTHFLEAWGDTRSTDGTISICQPLIAPIFENALSEIEFLCVLNGFEANYAHEYIKKYWKNTLASSGDFESLWRTYLAVGVITDAIKAQPINNYVWSSLIKQISTFKSNPIPSLSKLDIEFVLDRSVYDGRYTNNSWMQEFPDQIYKLVWDNALLISPKTAKALSLNGRPKVGNSMVDLVQITYKEHSMKVAIWELPGIADNTAVLSLGYGRNWGRVAKETGFNANLIRNSKTWFDNGLSIQKTGETYSLVSTQEHGSMNGAHNIKNGKDRPPVVRETSLSEFKINPNFVKNDELIPVPEQKDNLFKSPQDSTQSKWARQQWGMSIDLNTCTGCNACTIACQAENNISVVGKEEIFKNREMAWIRIDRYFTGEIDNPELKAVFQPLACQQCETAPCEAVCPVAATTHSPDGLNDMTYNRCVGTRYCANNCPYKVRRYNYLSYSKDADEKNPFYAMQKNPNVTVRFRGVMEKCSYCVQRINAAKIKANKINESDLIIDGDIVTACQSVCPTASIIFGDIADLKTRVSKLKSQSRNYALLGELNTRPRTTFLAKLRNVNPEIVL